MTLYNDNLQERDGFQKQKQKQKNSMGLPLDCQVFFFLGGGGGFHVGSQEVYDMIIQLWSLHVDVAQ